jgi:hypothetical protein
MKSDDKIRKIRKSRQRTNYKRIANDSRISLIHLVYDKNMAIKEAADKLMMNYSTAKTIVRVYRLENRAMKKNAEQEKILKKILLKNNNINKDEKLRTGKEMMQSSESSRSLSKFSTRKSDRLSHHAFSFSNENFKKSKILFILAETLSSKFNEVESLCVSFFNYTTNIDNMFGFNSNENYFNGFYPSEVMNYNLFTTMSNYQSNYQNYQN